MKGIKPLTEYVGHDGSERKTGMMQDDWLMYNKPDRRTASGWSYKSEWSTLADFEMWASHEKQKARSAIETTESTKAE